MEWAQLKSLLYTLKLARWLEVVLEFFESEVVETFYGNEFAK